MSNFVEALGWCGSILLIVAYVFATKNIFPATTWQSLTMNFLGAAFLLLNGFVHRAFPSVALNAIWVLISVNGLARTRRSSSSQQEKITDVE